jgi:hypothetical protein
MVQGPTTDDRLRGSTHYSSRAGNRDPTTTDSLVTRLGFNGVLGLSNLGYTHNAGPPEGCNLPEDGTLYARETKLKS